MNLVEKNDELKKQYLSFTCEFRKCNYQIDIDHLLRKCPENDELLLSFVINLINSINRIKKYEEYIQSIIDRDYEKLEYYFWHLINYEYSEFLERYANLLENPTAQRILKKDDKSEIK